MVVINLTAVAILIRRLGMTWTVFKPSNSLLQAEGNGMVVNSIKVPAVGTVLEFNRAERSSYTMNRAELLVPGRDIDALGFGLVRPWFKDYEHYMRMGTNDEYTTTMLLYCGVGFANRKTRDRIKSGAMTRCLADFIGLTARVMFIQGTSINRIPDPSPNSRGFLNAPVTLHAFHQRIVGYISKHQDEIEDLDLGHLHWIQDAWVELGVCKWTTMRSHTNSEDQKLLNTLHSTIGELEQWLRMKLPHGMYDLLLRQHVKMVVWAEASIAEELAGEHNVQISADDYGDESTERDYLAIQRYGNYVEDFNNWEDFAAKKSLLARKADCGLTERVPPRTSREVEEELRRQHTEIVVAWYTMIFRGMCWYRLHYLVPGSRVGSQYWDSQQSVYIT